MKQEVPMFTEEQLKAVFKHGKEQDEWIHEMATIMDTVCLPAKLLILDKGMYEVHKE